MNIAGRCVTRHTAKLEPEMCLAALCGCDPVILAEWRIVSHELLVSAFKIRDPIQVPVQVEANNFAQSAS